MPQCQTALVITPEMDIEAVLNQLSRATFNAEHAVQCEWDKHQFCIDSGMNNIRAVIDKEKMLILFCCRYSQYINIMEKLLTEFADQQDLLIENLKA
ncbi:hypothetical protein ACEI17_002631 [Vibrio vulnificus]|uniref:hypothetical protein n=1 Tax=Vibrio vulnificus TaxID=672 RepID=UPI00071FF8F2|nr:hypothetical protein [Vibrio vulnificus]ALM70321.1 hypothetical protein FORC9_0804 [Vibrio vulnificus]ANH63871.1 hypothetical protein FORC16_1988 [Vibrio vulnificus]EGR0086750.1 hypothetical protein [Vibrio vulnificus]EGR0106854.1 hypothetical protein [Vibrio vulnificus]EHY0958151.1 hypothetical protein [Vibrio vulnificus]